MSRMSLSVTGEKEERSESPTKSVSVGVAREKESSSFRMEAIFSEKNRLKLSGSLSRGMFKGKTLDSPSFPNNSLAIWKRVFEVLQFSSLPV